MTSPKAVRVVVLKDNWSLLTSSSNHQPRSVSTTLSSCSWVAVTPLLLKVPTTSAHHLLVVVGVRLDDRRHAHALAEDRHLRERRCRPLDGRPPTEQRNAR